MAEKTQKPGSTTEGAAGGEQKREITLRIDESDAHSAYANTFRADQTIDDVMLDFGVNRAVPGRNEMVFKVRQQVILNWRGTKRLALTLANLVRQYEERYGEIEMNPKPTQSKSESS
ncbi:MAG: DUF3467 domain-containing protein [Phycisphaerales bacterium]